MTSGDTRANLARVLCYLIRPPPPRQADRMSEEQTKDHRLDSWKSIAQYLNRDVRTVIRWEKERGLPIRRVPGGLQHRHGVFAYAEELDRWLAGTQVADIAGSSSAASLEGSALEMGVRSHPSKIFSSLRFGIIVLASLAILSLTVNVVSSHNKTALPQPARFKQLTETRTRKRRLVSDGRRLYFSELIDGRFIVSSIPVSGGTVTHFNTPFRNVETEDVSRDGTKLLVLSYDGLTETERPLWVLPTDGGTPSPVGNILCHSATWSRDGNSIAFATGKSIYVTSDHGVSRHEIGTFQSVPVLLRWSPDGSRLRFVLRDSVTLSQSPWEVLMKNGSPELAGTGIRFLPQSCCLGWSWSDDGNTFLYMGLVDQTIWSATGDRPAGAHHAVQLPPSLEPAVAPLATDIEGKKVFVLADTSAQGDFLKMDKRTREFRFYLPGLSGLYLDFSRDGKDIAYTSLKDATLWTSTIDGNQRKRLTSMPMEAELPRWSPDGKYIAFIAKLPGKPWRIRIISRDGGQSREVSPSDENQGAPTWSPDGKQLVYGNVYCEETRNCAIRVIEIETGKTTTLPNSDGYRTARWSYDGKYVAALEPHRHQLVLFDWVTQRWRTLVESVNGDDLNWSHDSRFVYVNRPTGDKPEIIRVDVRSGAAETVADLNSLEKLTNQIESWFTLASDDSLILLQRLRPEEIYVVDSSTNN